MSEFKIGDRVTEVVRTGTVVQVDNDNVPYKVTWDDGDTDWNCADDLVVTEVEPVAPAAELLGVHIDPFAANEAWVAANRRQTALAHAMDLTKVRIPEMEEGTDLPDAEDVIRMAKAFEKFLLEG